MDPVVGIASPMVWSVGTMTTPPNDPDERDEDDDIPETPTDEPPPPRIQDPPAEPGPQGPYVVKAAVRQ